MRNFPTRSNGPSWVAVDMMTGGSVDGSRRWSRGYSRAERVAEEAAGARNMCAERGRQGPDGRLCRRLRPVAALGRVTVWGGEPGPPRAWEWLRSPRLLRLLRLPREGPI